MQEHSEITQIVLRVKKTARTEIFGSEKTYPGKRCAVAPCTRTHIPLGFAVYSVTET
jgi:hypothetical protein